MREEFDQTSYYSSTWSWVWQALGALLGTATLISLIKHGFNIELRGIPAAMLNQYTWMRDTLFEPIVWALRSYGLSLPSWLKDLITAYALVTTSYWRALNTFGFEVIGWRRQAPLSEGWRKIRMLVYSIIWPLRPHPVHAAPYSLRRSFEDDEDARLGFEKMFRWRFVANLTIVLAAAVAFFLWNQISNLYGPGQ
jgi:hypothetical protein